MNDRLTGLQKQIVLHAVDSLQYAYGAFPVCIVLRDREDGSLVIVTGANVANVELTRVLREAFEAMATEMVEIGPETRI